MCFSAPVSFTASFGLSTVGIYLLIASKPRSIASLVSATMPLSFSLQQAAEGFVWVGLDQDDQLLAKSASLVYQFFVLFWLVYAPIFGLVNEPKQNNNRRQCFYICIVIGLIFGAYKFIPWLQNPDLILPQINHQCIAYYKQDYFADIPSYIEIILYMILGPTVLYVSSHRVMHIMATVAIVIMGITYFYYRYAFTSLWCFAVAILSVLMIHVEATLRKERVSGKWWQF